MKKAVLFLSIAGGILGITGNFIFYIFGSITAGIQNTIFKALLPGLDLSTADAAIQRILYINALTASLLCLAATIAGIVYFRGDEGEKKSGKYISTVILIAVSAGLIIALSFISLIPIGIAAILASISVNNDFRDQLIPEQNKVKSVIKITALSSMVVLIIIYFIPGIFS